MPLQWKPRDKDILRSWIDAIVNETSDKLNDWENNFIASIIMHMDCGRELSEAQEDKLEQIYVKHTS